MDRCVYVYMYMYMYIYIYIYICICAYIYIYTHRWGRRGLMDCRRVPLENSVQIVLVLVNPRILVPRDP